MSKADELRKLAQDCYERARVAVNSEIKRAFIQQGDDYLEEADGLRRERAVMQAVFPRPDLKIH